MHTETTKPEAMTFRRTYPGTEDQVQQVRRDLAPLIDGCPLADDFILIASELSTNAVVHSRSGQPGADDYGRGLVLVAALAGDGNWVIENGNTPGTRVVWVWLDWPGALDSMKEAAKGG